MAFEEHSDSEHGLKWEAEYDQGKNPFCTLYAISQAICDAGRQKNYRLNFNEIIQELRSQVTLKYNLSETIDGWYPYQFNGLELPFVSFGNINAEDDYGNIKIQVNEVPEIDINPYTFEEEYILVENRKPEQDHCMHIMCITQQDELPHFLCRDSKDSGSKEERYKIIFTGKQGNAVHMVTIEVNDEFTPPQSPESHQKEGTKWMFNDWNPEVVRRNQLESVLSITQTDSPASSSPWSKSYDSRALQCISYTISERCKQVGSYIHPNTIRSSIINTFLLEGRDVMEELNSPVDLNMKILSGLDMDDIDTKEESKLIPLIELSIQLDKKEYYRFKQEYVLSDNRSNEMSWYFVLCKSSTESQDYFVCRDIATVIGPKQYRFPRKNVEDEEVSIFKVNVSEPIIDEMDDGWSIM